MSCKCLFNADHLFFCLSYTNGSTSNKYWGGGLGRRLGTSKMLMKIFTTVRIVLWEAIEAFGPHFRWKCRVWLNVDFVQVDNKVLHCLVILRRHCKHCCKELCDLVGWKAQQAKTGFQLNLPAFDAWAGWKRQPRTATPGNTFPEGSVGDYFKIEISHCDCQWRALLFTSLNIVSCVCPALLGF